MVNTASTRQQPGLACEECRRRKARCDRVRPQCGICAEAGVDCVVVDKRSRRGPRKGQLKDLRSRVALLERRLVNQNKVYKDDDNGRHVARTEITPEAEAEAEAEAEGDSFNELHLHPYSVMDRFTHASDDAAMSDFYRGNGHGMFPSPDALDAFMTSSTVPFGPITPPSPSRTCPSDGEVNMLNMLNMSDLMRAELDLIYFERVHHIFPMIHKQRYLSWAGENHPSPARACLRLAMRTVAAAASAQFGAVSDALYAVTRHMLDDEEHWQGEKDLPWIATRVGGQTRQDGVEHERIQAWLLLAHYEFMRKPEQQALITTDRALRLLQLSRLFALDIDESSGGSGSKNPAAALVMAPSQGGWIEREEKRRTMWTAFVLDRLSSMLNNRPLVLHEEMIRTRLPMAEADFQNAREPSSRMGFLPETMDSRGSPSASASASASPSPFTECVMLANLVGRCVAHRRLAQSTTTPFSDAEPGSGDFWARHEWLAASVAAAMERRLRADADDAAAAAAAARGPDSPRCCDAAPWFNRVLAFSASVSLSETAAANPWLTLDGHLMAVSYRQMAYDAASEVVLLVKTAPRFALFKMHPLVPNVLSLVVNFLGGGQGRVCPLVDTLRRLSEINNLARDLLLKLQVDGN